MIISNLYHLNLENSIKTFNSSKTHSSFDEILSQYTVKKGDNLFGIVKRHLKEKGLNPSNADIMRNVEIIAKLNNIKNPDLIFSGQVIKFDNIKNNFSEHFLFPISNGRISSKFGMRVDPFNKTMRFHEGIDIAAPIGTPVKAAEDGKVIFSGKERGYGNIVIIKHKNGLITKYAHNSKNLVKAGDYVKKGEAVSLVGSTGRSTGPHLHFEVRKNNKPVNPMNFLNV